MPIPGHILAFVCAFLVMMTILMDPTAKSIADTRTLALAGGLLAMSGDCLITALFNYLRR